MKETKRGYYFETYYDAKKFQEKHGGKIRQSILPGYMTAETIFCIEKKSIKSQEETRA